MPEHDQPNLRHILVTRTARTEKYVSPTSGRREFAFPPRSRRTHGKQLLKQLERVAREAATLGTERRAFARDAEGGIYVTFESEPGFELKLESLEVLRSGIELLTVTQKDGKTLATVFIPEGKLEHFVKLVNAYLEDETRTGKPKNQSMIDSISDIHRAFLEELWTDDPRELPDDQDTQIRWEVWLRIGRDRQAELEKFRHSAERIGINVGNEEIHFIDRTVVIARGSRAQMSRSVSLLNAIAELRLAKETADFFTAMGPVEQENWVDDALRRLSGPHGDYPAVCLLDTGVNSGHPLLQPATKNEDLHAYGPGWNVSDHHGHGTEMAGLCLFGDLIGILSGGTPIELRHGLESVKILPPNGQNPPDLYGAVTAESIARAEVSAPNRKRIICLAVSIKDFRDKGRPSSWSARLDSLTSGSEDEVRRLLVVAAGNTHPETAGEYPSMNMTDGIHDPGQSWNSVTVGAYTEKITIDQSEYPGAFPLAPSGDVSPTSCTSIVWERPWPLKPDIVMEGGNLAIMPSGQTEFLDSLQLLSTYYKFGLKLLVTTGDTSAAAAITARMAIILLVEYPELWPETIRALLVHSAKWTPAMLRRFEPLTTRRKKEQLLRYCGFGVPNLGEAIWSASNRLTLLAQDTLQPFDKVDGTCRTRDLNIHKIPWPKETLQDLGDVPVEMRVTLSYFIEPNPARRGWIRKHRYASHGLRFDVKTPTETLAEFRKRINKAARDEESGQSTSSDADRWFLGPDLRSAGSIHSDRWEGSAAELAERGYIAVYPVIGWWRERHQLERWGKKARYALIVTLRTPMTNVDIYTSVVNLIRPQVQVEI
jgi:hypothetical protein